MEIRVLKRNDTELRVEVLGESHSFCNALQNFILKDESVEFASYDLSHPLVGNPTIYVRTNGKRRPEDALIEATESLNKTLGEVREAFLEAWREER